MAIETIKYTVEASGINPKVRQCGGVQGDHEKVQLEFQISDSLYNYLDLFAKEKGCLIYYRLDRYNGEGKCEPTSAQELASKIIVYPLEEWITRYGGIIKVVLVLTIGDEKTTLTEMYNFPAILSLKSRPTGSELNPKQYQSMSIMSAEARSAAEKAKADAARAEEAAERTEAARFALEKGAEFIFDGNSDTAPDVKLVIENSISETSENPVQSKIIAEELSKIRKRVDEAIIEVNKISDRTDIYMVKSGDNYRIWSDGTGECWHQIFLNKHNDTTVISNLTPSLKFSEEPYVNVTLAETNILNINADVAYAWDGDKGYVHVYAISTQPNILDDTKIKAAVYIRGKVKVDEENTEGV